MVRTLLSDEAGKKVEAILPGKEGDRRRAALDNRWFLEAVLWIGRMDDPWRDLPVQIETTDGTGPTVLDVQTVRLYERIAISRQQMRDLGQIDVRLRAPGLRN